MTINTNKKKLKLLNEAIHSLYQSNKDALPFHGWHHVNFVRNKALEFAQFLNADFFIVESSALTHDINYIVRKNSLTSEGSELRSNILLDCQYSNEEVNTIDKVIITASNSVRLNYNLSNESKALSDADTLFKALPITPILFASKFLIENDITIDILANKIIDSQLPLFNEDVYFYTELANNKYLNWAKTNLELWKNVCEALNEEQVKQLLRECGDKYE